MKKFIKNNAVIILFTFAALIVLLLSIYTRQINALSIEILEYNLEHRLVALAKSASQLVSVEELEQFQTPEDMEKPLYGELKQRLDKFTRDSDVLYAYYMRPAGDKLQYIVDNDFDPETLVDLATAPEEAEPSAALALAGKSVSSGISNYSEGWDGLLTAYAPVYDAAGEIYCVAGVDMRDDQVVSIKARMDILTVLMVVTVLIVFASGIIGFTMYRKKADLSQSANIAKSNFLSRMSHEIRTPMNAIIGLCRMAKETDSMPRVQEYLDSINVSSIHLLELINDILDLSTIESGRVEIEEEAISNRAEIEALYHMILPQAEAKHQTLTFDVGENIPTAAYADSSHIRQVMVNLLSNAVKFTPENGTIRFSVYELERKGEMSHMQWTVEDNGIGIGEDYLDQLFDPFEQADGGANRKYGGTGLGLAISKQLVDMMDGSINVQSKKGEGSTFIVDIWLKVAPESAAPTPEYLPLDAGVDLSGKHILLVEDSEINQIVAEDVISSFGANVHFANNGEEGLKAFLKEPGKYDMIFMDVQMPVMDGYEATRQIRASGAPGAKSIPIIAMTANVFREDIQKAFEAGMNAHVGKPFEVDQVKQAILEVLQ